MRNMLPWWMLLILRKVMWGGNERGYMEIELSAQFFCDPKAFIKMTNQNNNMGGGRWLYG